MDPKPLVCGTVASHPRGGTQPRLVYSSHPCMENQLIAVIVRFPSALPTTKSRDPGGHLSVYQDLLYHQEAEFLPCATESLQQSVNSNSVLFFWSICRP